MRIHYLQHVPFEGLGCIETWCMQHGHSLNRTRLYAGDPLPAMDTFDWLIVMGGPMSIHDEFEYPWLKVEKNFIRWALEADKTVVGICLGAQLLACLLGAEVRPGRQKEIGWYPVTRASELAGHPLAGVIAASQEVFHWHGETFDLPEESIRIASSAVCENQGFVYRDRVIGLQYHLEMTAVGAETLIQHSGDELVDGPTIQSAEAMLDKPERFTELNQSMFRLLDYLQAHQA